MNENNNNHVAVKLCCLLCVQGPKENIFIIVLYLIIAIITQLNDPSTRKYNGNIFFSYKHYIFDTVVYHDLYLVVCK